MKKLLCIFIFILLNISVVLSQETVEELNKKGLDLYNKGKYEEAINCFDKALKINDDVYQVWNNKGLVYYKLKKYEEAVKCFEKALSINPGYTTAWYNKGSALFMMKNYNGAIVCFDKVLSQDPKHSGAKSKKEQSLAALDSQKSIKGFIDKGMASYNQEKYDDAVSYYDKALTLDPVNETALVKKGDALAKQGKYDDSIRCYDKVLEINKKNTEALYGKGNVLFAQGKYKEAVEYYNKILAIKPDDSNAKIKKSEAEKALSAQQTPSAAEFFQEGEDFFKKKNFEEALKYYNKALAVDPNHVPSLFKKGAMLIIPEIQKADVMIDSNKIKEGYGYIDKVTALAPEFAEAWDLKGEVLTKAGKYDKALECYNKVFALKPDFPDIQAKIEETEKALTGQPPPVTASEAYKEFYDKGCKLYKEGHFEEALKNFQQSLNINQQYVPALFKKGFTLITLSRGKKDEKNKEVIKCFLEINKLDPGMKQCDINGTDDRGSTPLHIATAIENEILAEELIKNGADVNIKNNNGDTPLHLAAKNYSKKKDLRKKEIEIAKMLLNTGADVNSKNNDGFTPLHNASAAGNTKMAELLISKGADVNSKDKNGNTPLKKAGTSEMKDLLRANGAKE